MCGVISIKTSSNEVSLGVVEIKAKEWNLNQFQVIHTKYNYYNGS